MLAAFVAAVGHGHPYPVTLADTNAAHETLQQATARA